MFCHKCGNQIADGSAFCSKCGAKQSADVDVREITATESPNIMQSQTKPDNAKKKKSRKLPIILGVAVLVIAVVIFVALNWEGKTNYEATVRAYAPYANSQGLPYTCGEVIDKYIPDAEWKIRQSGEIVYVDISGIAKGTEKELVIAIQVETKDDRAFIDPIAVKVDERETSSLEEAETIFYAFFVAYDKKYDDLSNFAELGSEIEATLQGKIELTETYTNEVEGISFRYPSEWMYNDMADYGVEAASGFSVICMIANDSPYSQITVSKNTNPQFVESVFLDNSRFLDTFGYHSDAFLGLETSVEELNGIPARLVNYVIDGKIAHQAYIYVNGSALYQVEFTCQNEDIENQEKLFNAIIESYRITQTDAGNLSTGGAIDSIIGLYAPIIDAYATLEQSGYTVIDESLIGDSLLAAQQNGTYNFGWDELPELGYAIYDLNSNGSPELLIGAKSYGDYILSGIYTLSSGSPVSLIQVEDQCSLSVTADLNNNCVIGYSWGHMGAAGEVFFTLVPDAETEYLGLLCELYTEPGDPAPIRFEGDYTGEGENVRITEEEYASIIQQYGALGYETFDTEPRNVSFDWAPILSE